MQTRGIVRNSHTTITRRQKDKSKQSNHSQGYKTFFVLNSTEHEISTAH